MLSLPCRYRSADANPKNENPATNIKTQNTKVDSQDDSDPIDPHGSGLGRSRIIIKHRRRRPRFWTKLYDRSNFLPKPPIIVSGSVIVSSSVVRSVGGF
jgi:hypothetical protein